MTRDTQPAPEDEGITIDWSNPSAACCPWPICRCASQAATPAPKTTPRRRARGGRVEGQSSISTATVNLPTGEASPTSLPGEYAPP